ncbi:Golgi apparatus membrane protein TVP23 homolog B-like [Bolinopsis microptera]|uniref:Golgi apparatus membrane protein TVP23 homolog B-like n=1 Tax=Bolinopsis microptera TaxID=2820187 RepID=UPI0030797412
MDLSREFGDDTTPSNGLKHPTASLFHILFRTLAVVVYLFCTLFGGGFTLTFVLVVLLLAADFWTVKNITGRLLVGLRWWNKVNEDGSTEWIFESRKEGASIHHSATEQRIFWIAMFTSSLVWFILLIKNLLSFSLGWIVVDITAVVLNAANLYGYIKCRRDAKAKVQGAVGSFLGRQLFNSMVSGEGQGTSQQQTR